MAADIPEELIEDILLKLPVKSIVRFKTTSKKWYSLLSQDDNFAKSYLKQSRSNKNLIFMKIGKTTRYQSSNVDDTNSSLQELNFPVEIATSSNLIGSANGLICVAPCYAGGCFIWNPFTGECKKISTEYLTKAGCNLFGFGYDSFSDDYKIVGNWAHHFRVFSLKTNSWKILEHSNFYESVNAVHLNGVLHWYCGSWIASFDLATEKFFYMEIPKEVKFAVTGLYHRVVPLLVHQGLLCISEGKSIWVMKKYGDSKSWAKLTTFVANEHVYPVSVSRSGEVLFLTRYNFDIRLVKSNIQGRISDDELEMISHCERAFVYKESVISPNCFDGPHSRSKKVIKRPRKQRKTI